MPKLCQLMATFEVVWVTVICPEVPPITALPAVTVPPVGAACTAAPQTQTSAQDNGRQSKLVDGFLLALVFVEHDLLNPDACSDVATQVPVEGLQIDRKIWFMVSALKVRGESVQL